MMTSGVCDRISQFVDLRFHYNFEDMLMSNKKELAEFRVEFGHVRLIVFGYIVALSSCGVIFLCEMMRKRFFQL